jgi:transposase
VPAEADETDIPGQCPANVPIPVPVEPSPILKADPNRTVTFAAQQDGPLRVTCSSWPNAVAIWSEAAFRLLVQRTLREQTIILHRRLLAIVRDDEVCRRLMTIPGVGPVAALTYRATVDVDGRGASRAASSCG